MTIAGLIPRFGLFDSVFHAPSFFDVTLPVPPTHPTPPLPGPPSPPTLPAPPR